MTPAENKDCSRDMVIRVSPGRNSLVAEEQKPGGIVAYKKISPVDLYFAINGSYLNDETLSSGFLPENCLHVSMDRKEKFFTIWNPELRSDVMYRDMVCTGNNVLPRYKKQTLLRNFPRFLLGLPDNDDMYDSEKNKLHLSHGELMEHLKDKEPAYYYSNILVPNGKTLQDFISRRYYGTERRENDPDGIGPPLRSGGPGVAAAADHRGQAAGDRRPLCDQPGDHGPAGR